MSERNKARKRNSVFDKRLETLAECIADLKEKECHAEIAGLLAEGCSPRDLLDSCVQGMQEIGQRFEDGRYYIAALIMGGDIMSQITELIEPHLSPKETDHIVGSLLLGTVAGDIHDLGKNLFAILARCRGIKVIDLGVDVKADDFVDGALQYQPDIIGISCVLSTGWTNLEETVRRLCAELPHPRPAIIIGGSNIDDYIYKHVKSDFWARDASQGVEMCLKVINKTSS